jgi:hypothetical protein
MLSALAALAILAGTATLCSAVSKKEAIAAAETSTDRNFDFYHT